MNIDDRLTPEEMKTMRKARDIDARQKLTLAQNSMAAQLQRALQQLPLEVIENHISVALDERSDFDVEQAQRFARMFNDKAWQFI